MKSIADVLKQKEAELQRIQVEVDALNLALRLVSEDDTGSNGRPLAQTGTTSGQRVEEIKAGVRNPRQFP